MKSRESLILTQELISTSFLRQHRLPHPEISTPAYLDHIITAETFALINPQRRPSHFQNLGYDPICIVGSGRLRRAKRSIAAPAPPQPPPNPIETGTKPLGASDSAVGAIVGSLKSGDAAKTPRVTRRRPRFAGWLARKGLRMPTTSPDGSATYTKGVLEEVRPAQPRFAGSHD